MTLTLTLTLTPTLTRCDPCPDPGGPRTCCLSRPAQVVDSLLEECFAHRRNATLPAAKAAEVQRQLRLEKDQEVAALHHAVCQLVWHVTEAPNAPSNLFIKKEVAALFPEGFHEDLKALLVDVVAKKVPPWKQEIQGGGKPGQQPKKDSNGKKSTAKFRSLDAGPRSDAAPRDAKGIKQAKEAVLAEAASDAPGQAPHEGAAGDTAAMLRWLERREAEAARDPDTVATMLLAPKLPQMVLAILGASPPAPHAAYRKLIALLLSPALLEAQGEQAARAEALYWRLLESSFFTPQPLDGGGGGSGGGDEAEEAEQGLAPAVAYVVSLPQMTRERQGAARASLSSFTEAVTMLELLHAHFGGSSGEQAETTHARLGPLVAPLRSAARALNLSMQAGGASQVRLRVASTL